MLSIDMWLYPVCRCVKVWKTSILVGQKHYLPNWRSSLTCHDSASCAAGMRSWQKMTRTMSHPKVWAKSSSRNWYVQTRLFPLKPPIRFTIPDLTALHVLLHLTCICFVHSTHLCSVFSGPDAETLVATSNARCSDRWEISRHIWCGFYLFPWLLTSRWVVRAMSVCVSSG